MVWFQCEDCGENLKKPKLANHFRMCSAYKLSCIDCGEFFSKESVQSHTQCISEAEKYGPKGQGKPSNNAQTKPDKPKPNSEVDVNVGLSSHPPWSCSLCNTTTTSKQTLLGHADGKKHRAKARAFHAAQKLSNQTPDEKGITDQKSNTESVEADGSKDKLQERDLVKDTDAPISEENESQRKKKRKQDASGGELAKKTEENNVGDLSNGEVIQGEQTEGPQHKAKKKKHADDELLHSEDQIDKQVCISDTSKDKIKWKKLVTSTLKSNSGLMKIKKLQKLVMKALKESGATEDEVQLKEKLMHKITSSSRFAVDNKHIHLVVKSLKTEES